MKCMVLKLFRRGLQGDKGVFRRRGDNTGTVEGEENSDGRERSKEGRGVETEVKEE